MTIKEIAELLAQQGHEVSFRKRADGGYIITRIDGVSFKGATGNIQARKITGAELSHARSFQLARIKPPKNVAPTKRKLTALPDDLKKELKKVQRLWRKKHADIGGTISVRGLRYQYEHYGYDIAKASLNKAFRYSQGYAYIENVQWLIERLRQDMNKADLQDSTALSDIINRIQEKMLSFKEEWISEIYQELYEYEKGSLSANDLTMRIILIMK